MRNAAPYNPAPYNHLRDFAHSLASAIALGLFVTGLFAVLYGAAG